jgi:hypothetical protein
VRLGLLLPTMRSADVDRAALNAAEQVGVDDVWVLDHMMGQARVIGVQLPRLRTLLQEL